MTATRPILLILFLFLLAMPFLLFGFFSVKILEPRLLSEFETQTRTAAVGVQRRIDRAVEAFGGLHALRDVEPVLHNARLSAPGMSFLALTDSDGTILYRSAGRLPECPPRMYGQISGGSNRHSRHLPAFPCPPPERWHDTPTVIYL
ncbi:MAG: hypothetical protein GDA36_05240 [Rhodobacteraceae bacterium]|nr:hypothetical protein [Paracoccaceae bacterium]